MLSAKALKIVWHDDPRYWEWRHRHGSRFHEVAYLIEVCWFSVSGYLDCRMPPGAYTVSFRLQLNDESDGWSEMPVNFLLSTSDGQHSQSQRYLNLDGDEDLDEDQLELVDLTSRRVVADDWMEYDVGEFTTMSIDEPIQIQFSMKDTEGNHWKRGLFLDGVVIRPSYLVPHYVSEEGE
ncbi:hypothetical protein O6H91_22G061800 [Diphasiastrum complanatum]|uniref:Uncharacterized protein n=1 Tax=Diphasiastrum complanatum TaxID=34168 RepID=A0ACC2AG41_DIPCM|nr:hypothetical protein O6H91_22G061800 [Diphasiastrum complanatum]